MYNLENLDYICIEVFKENLGKTNTMWYQQSVVSQK